MKKIKNLNQELQKLQKQKDNFIPELSKLRKILKKSIALQKLQNYCMKPMKKNG